MEMQQLDGSLLEEGEDTRLMATASEASTPEHITLMCREYDERRRARGSLGRGGRKPSGSPKRRTPPPRRLRGHSDVDSDSDADSSPTSAPSGPQSLRAGPQRERRDEYRRGRDGVWRRAQRRGAAGSSGEMQLRYTRGRGSPHELDEEPSSARERSHSRAGSPTAEELRAAMLSEDREGLSAEGDSVLTDLIDTMIDEVVDEVVAGLAEDTETCPICFEDVRLSAMETTPCNHRLCTVCCTKIKETRPFCPMCRARIGEDPPSPFEDSVLHLLVGLLSMSHSVGVGSSVGREARRVLHDIVLAMHAPMYGTIRFDIEPLTRPGEDGSEREAGDSEDARSNSPRDDSATESSVDAATPATPSSPDEPIPPLTPPEFRQLHL